VEIHAVLLGDLEQVYLARSEKDGDESQLQAAQALAEMVGVREDLSR
jgi:hypothetical protein